MTPPSALVYVSNVVFPPAPVPLNRRLHVADTLFESYLDGLTYEGWHGDSRVVRFGFATSAALRAVMVIPRLVNLAVKLNAAVVSGHENDNQQNDNQQLQKMLCFSNTAEILLDLADEAYSLIDIVWA
jgi:hypothetical protein